MNSSWRAGFLRFLVIGWTGVLFCPSPAHAVTPTFVPLGDLPGNTSTHFLSGAHAVSPDGSVVVGQSESASGREAFVWTAEGGMVGLGDLPGGLFDSAALGVSADGLVIVGYSASTLNPEIPGEVFRWTAQTGMVGLGLLPGGELGSPKVSVARAISADGSVIVGEAKGQIPTNILVQPFRWTEAEGMMSLGYLTSSRCAANRAIENGLES